MRLTNPKARIERWADSYGSGRIFGYVDGREILTSKVVDIDVEARRVMTQSGSVYELGEAYHDTHGDISRIGIP